MHLICGKTSTLQNKQCLLSNHDSLSMFREFLKFSNSSSLCLGVFVHFSSPTDAPKNLPGALGLEWGGFSVKAILLQTE